MKVGYVRCSTAEQNEARQMKMMEEQKVKKVFIDKASGKNVDRKDFKAMMAFVRAGDTVIVESISRIARNTRDLLTIPLTRNCTIKYGVLKTAISRLKLGTNS